MLLARDGEFVFWAGSGPARELYRKNASDSGPLSHRSIATQPDARDRCCLLSHVRARTVMYSPVDKRVKKNGCRWLMPGAGTVFAGPESLSRATHHRFTMGPVFHCRRRCRPCYIVAGQTAGHRASPRVGACRASGSVSAPDSCGSGNLTTQASAACTRAGRLGMFCAEGRKMPSRVFRWFFYSFQP